MYGYHASWAGTLEDLPWDRLTHVAIFDVGVSSSGTVAWPEGPTLSSGSVNVIVGLVPRALVLLTWL